MRPLFYTLCLLCFISTASAQVGSLDPTFGTGGITISNVGAGRDEINAIALQQDGKIVVAGHSSNGSNLDFLVARYTFAGILDPAFGAGDGIVTTPISSGDDDAFSVAVQSDGYIVVAGYSSSNGGNVAVVRYEPDGDLDLGFGTGGKVNLNIPGGAGQVAQGLAIQPDGKIVVVGNTEGSTHDFLVVRLETDGDPDPLFGGGDGIVVNDISNFDEYATSVIILPDSRIFVAGYSGSSSFRFFTMARYNTDGSFDTSFDGTGWIVSAFQGSPAHDEAYSVIFQNDGKFLMGGQIMRKTAVCCGHYDFGVARFNADGSLDNTYGEDGIARVNIGGATLTEDFGKSMALQADGKVIVAGLSGADFTLVRLTAAGIPDVTFSGDGILEIDLGNDNNDFSYALKLQANRIYVAGSTGVLPNLSMAIIALQNDAVAAAPLPLSLQHFSAQKQSNNAIQLNWQTELEEDIMQFDIERSADGRNFAPIGMTSPLSGGSFKKSYTFVDKQPLTGVNFYRLRIKEMDGKNRLSHILALKTNKLGAQLEVFPNPVGRTLRMQLPDGLKGRIDVAITDASGRVVATRALNGNGNSVSLSIEADALKKGVYIIKAQANSTVVTGKFIKE